MTASIDELEKEILAHKKCILSMVKAQQILLHELRLSFSMIRDIRRELAYYMVRSEKEDEDDS